MTSQSLKSLLSLSSLEWGSNGTKGTNMTSQSRKSLSPLSFLEEGPNG